MVQSSDRVSAIAGRLVNLQQKDIEQMTLSEQSDLASDVRSIAASVLRQDEYKGLRGRIRKIIAG